MYVMWRVFLVSTSSVYSVAAPASSVYRLASVSSAAWHAPAIVS